MTDVLIRLTSALSDRYRIDRELGQGGMATVYLAHDRRHERDVAIKVLHPDLGAALGGDRFLSEIRTTARLQHPHILPLLDSGDADGLLFYVMPLVTGETLRARLERERQLPIDDAILVAREVADALGYAHGLGIIHRDIKPENILLQGGHALVADFGIALAVQTAAGQRMTQTGLSLGTPQYMSPEQAMGERAIDARSDIYALGAVTYEMLVGEPPFTGPSVQAIVARLITEEPRGLAAQRKAVPEAVEAAVLRALEKLPADRFATAAEFATALRAPSPASGGTASRRLPPPAAPARSWTRAAAWDALGAAGVAAGWAAAALRRPAAADAALTLTSILPPAGGNFGEQRSVALSPDGRRLAFVFAAANGSRTLWIRRLDRLDAEAVPQTTGADAPFWSPDGRSLGFFAGGFLSIADENGDIRRLCPVTGATSGSWGSRGIIVFGHREGVSIVPADGGDCRRVVARGNWPAPRAAFLPDGRRFIYSRGRQLGLIAAGLDGKTIDSIPMPASDFAIVPSGYLVAPGRTDARALDAQQLDLHTLKFEGPVVRLASEVRNQAGIPTFAVSSSDAMAFLMGGRDRPYLVYDGSGLLRDTVRVEGTWTVGMRRRPAGSPVVAVAGNVVGLWLYDLDANRATRLPVRDSAFSTAGVGLGTTWPVFSEDGTRLVFALVGLNACRIMERDLRTDAERIVREDSTTSSSMCRYPLDWSADGHSLLVRRDTVLELLALDGSAPPRDIVRPGRVWEGHISPDGRAVAYSSDETGRAEVYLQALPSGLPLRVSLEGGRWPAWVDGGRRVLFVTPDGRVQDVAVGAGATSSATPRTRFSIPTWRRSTFDDGGTGFAVVGDGERYIVRQSASALAVTYVQHWSALFHRAGTPAAARP